MTSEIQWDFLVQRYIYDKPAWRSGEFSGDTNETVEKCSIPQCWRIIQKIARSGCG